MVPTTSACTWWNRPEEDLSSGKLECCCLPTPMTLASGGESDVPACGPPASFSVHLASSAVTTAGSIHKSRGDNVVRMWVQLKRGCVSCVWMLQRGHSGDGCVWASTSCKYDWRKGYLFVLSWAREC